MAERDRELVVRADAVLSRQTLANHVDRRLAGPVRDAAARLRVLNRAHDGGDDEYLPPSARAQAWQERLREQQRPHRVHLEAAPQR